MRFILIATGAFFAASLAVSAAELLPAETPVNVAIDFYVNQRLEQEEVTPAQLVGDENLIRRLTLDLAGRIPTLAETQAYVRSQTPQKWTLLADRLLESPDYGYHHRNELDVMLLAGKKNDNEWREYLLKAAAENRRWDNLFREMMIGSEEKPDQKPALTFLKLRAKSIDDLTNDTSRIFFGINVSCAKCHDHPLVEDWKQDHYYGMSSFFSRTYLTKKNTLAEKYSGSVKFKTTAGVEKQAKFMFLTGSSISEPAGKKTKEQRKAEDAEVKRQMKDDKAPPPKPPEFSPRAKLVELALRSGENRFFARNIVNRLWARMLGRGIVDPLDQLHSENYPSHPELLDWLERDFIAHNFDMKRILRGIALSNTYARSSRWDGDSEVPDDDYFAVAMTRALSPRQYALSLNVACASPASFPLNPKPKDWSKRRKDLENASAGLAGLFEIPGEHFQVGVDEALLFSNSEQIQNDILRDSGDRLVGYLKKINDPRKLIERAFWIVFSRAPDAKETQALESFLAKRTKNRVSGIQQLAWALITSPEVRFNY